MNAFSMASGLWLLECPYEAVGQAVSSSFQVPWSAVAVAVCSIFAVVFSTMLYAMGRIKRENPIDALKNENT